MKITVACRQTVSANGVRALLQYPSLSGEDLPEKAVAFLNNYYLSLIEALTGYIETLPAAVNCARFICDIGHLGPLWPGGDPVLSLSCEFTLWQNNRPFALRRFGETWNIPHIRLLRLHEAAFPHPPLSQNSGWYICGNQVKFFRCRFTPELAARLRRSQYGEFYVYECLPLRSARTNL